MLILRSMICLFLISFLLFSCGSDDDSNATTGYNGPGSDYSMNLGASSFSVTEADEGWSASGSVATLSTGFKKLTVSSLSDNGSSEAPTLSEVTYVLDIPGVVLLMKPFSNASGEQIITMVKSGECPTENFTANWVNTSKDIDLSSERSSRDVYGTFNYTHTTSSATLPSMYAFDDTSLGSNSLGNFGCSNGIATVSDAKMYLTQVGGAIVRTGTNTPSDDTDDSFIVAMAASSISSASSLDGTYTGLLFEGSAGGDDISPVQATLASGSGNGYKITDMDNGTLEGSGVAISIGSVNSPSAGFFAATLGGQAANCMATLDVNGSGKNFIFCIGENPGEANQLYNLLLISQ